ncbi:MAG TPA: ATP-binding cassette domain-containing protein, partial [Candidatus Polarisedimenticolaceae bacterium]|nr:ATP-binding cassette domain-containing protein [Candidatus Polarisedimenticolaceae bacterium]
DARVAELLALVGLPDSGGKYPAQLSGGQQQRVALARALAHRPDVLLLDEPFGALDARIRAELRRTVRAIQRELKVTTIFVTHDQEEAYELADRLGVMNLGRLLEVGTPNELYLHPETEFVASFLGTANLLVGDRTSQGVQIGPLRLPLSSTAAAAAGESRRVLVLFRPEDVAVKAEPESVTGPPLGEAIVEERHFTGSLERLRLRLPGMPGVRQVWPPTPFGEDALLLEAARSTHLARRFPLAGGDRCWVGLRRVHALKHPGLSLLLVAGDSSELTLAALDLGARLAHHAHARALARTQDERTLRARLQLGSGATAAGLGVEWSAAEEVGAEVVLEEATRRHYDLVVHALPPRGGPELCARLLRDGDHHLLLVPGRAPAVQRMLVCAAIGEPAKEGVIFAGRVARQLDAEVTLLSVLAPAPGDGAGEPEARRFLEAARRSLALLGVAAA